MPDLSQTDIDSMGADELDTLTVDPATGDVAKPSPTPESAETTESSTPASSGPSAETPEEKPATTETAKEEQRAARQASQEAAELKKEQQALEKQVSESQTESEQTTTSDDDQKSTDDEPDEKTKQIIEDNRKFRAQKEAEAAKSRQEIAALKAKLREHGRPTFQEKSQEELDELKEDDPVAWRNYFVEKERFAHESKDYEAETEQSLQDLQRQEAVAFIVAKTGWDAVADEDKINAFMDSEETKQFAQKMGELIPLTEGEFYRADQLRLVYDSAMQEGALHNPNGTPAPEPTAEEKAAAAEAAAKKKAAEATQDFDLANNERRGTDSLPSTKNITQSDIDNMTEEQLDELAQTLRQEEMEAAA